MRSWLTRGEVGSLVVRVVAERTYWSIGSIGLSGFRTIKPALSLNSSGISGITALRS